MNYAGKEIKKLTDDELCDAIHSVVGIDKNRLDKLEQSRKRHKTIFEKHPPVENQTFINLANELNKEFKSRGLKSL